ncbi:MAG: 3-deoxy-D-manno-octulosonic acid transferase [Planctomycetota bacterium]|nr:3-deoxy-D-manno-octulosonic acid transferase [Planctomycetota bacterium]
MIIITDIIYVLYILICLPYYLFRFLQSGYHRKGLLERLGFISRRSGNKPCLWLHCSSVGEINASQVLIQKLIDECHKGAMPPLGRASPSGGAPRRQIPFSTLESSYELVISTTTPSAQKLVKDKYPHLMSFFFPLDLSIIIHKVLNRIKPNLIILIEQELWPNLISIAASPSHIRYAQCKQDGGYHKKIPLVLLNGRISKHSTRRYRLIKPIISRIYNQLSYLCVQNKDYFERFLSLGVDVNKIIITGNMKYDLSYELLDPALAGSLQSVRPASGGHNSQSAMVIVAGSTHPPEEEIIIDVYSMLKKEFSDLRLVIAPRHPFRFDEVEKLIKAKGFEVHRRSSPQSAHTGLPLVAIHNPQSVILLDTIGELAKVYSLADIVFVGGSMGGRARGGQSPLEPASLSKPILFGKDMNNFQDIATQLIKEGGAISVQDKNELYSVCSRLLKDPALLKTMGERNRHTISQYQGSTDKNMEIIRKLLTREPGAI